MLENEKKSKQLYLLTATPVNNRLADFRHIVELFSREDEGYFGSTLGVHNLRSHFNQMERELRKQIGSDHVSVEENFSETQSTLAKDPIFTELVVQRSRAYVIDSQKREGKNEALFPKRMPPMAASYSLKKNYGTLIEKLSEAFQKKDPLFSLAIYYPLAYYKGKDKDIDDLEKGRQEQVVALIRTQFLKRFESSIVSFEISCIRLLKKLLAFVEKNSKTQEDKKDLDHWKRQKKSTLKYIADKSPSVQTENSIAEDDNDEDSEDDILTRELLEAAEELPPKKYKIKDMLKASHGDLHQLTDFIDETRGLNPRHDDKLKELVKLLKTELSEQKVIVFTEFADTARYLFQELKEAKIKNLQKIDGSNSNRADIIRNFAPYYNGSSSSELGDKEIRVLISTDVLSEGLNLQDASKLINYDIHWNPVRLMQRIGRVDRRMNPDIEKQMLKDHPQLKKTRGKVSFWNFLPPNELDVLLNLYKRVAGKTLIISKALGIEHKKLLRHDDNYDELRPLNIMFEFEEEYLGQKSLAEEIQSDYQTLLIQNPNLLPLLKSFPLAVFSGRKQIAKGVRGVFFCFALPALDKNKAEFTLEAGSVRWYLYDLSDSKNPILSSDGDLNKIYKNISCKPKTPRHCNFTQTTLKEAKERVIKHIRNNYLKRIHAPIGVEPVLKCWMELNE